MRLLTFIRVLIVTAALVSLLLVAGLLFAGDTLAQSMPNTQMCNLALEDLNEDQVVIEQTMLLIETTAEDDILFQETLTDTQVLAQERYEAYATREAQEDAEDTYLYYQFMAFTMLDDWLLDGRMGQEEFMDTGSGLLPAISHYNQEAMNTTAATCVVDTGGNTDA